jgi:precorrin-6y C5,15-methyltransferase (decarboxylating) CbiE subunit
MKQSSQERRRIAVVGVGPGAPDYVAPLARRKAEEADVLVGGRHALALFDDLGKPTFEVTADLAAVVDYLKALPAGQRAAVLVSGDPLVFSLLTHLRRHFAADDIEVVPGISSIQLALAKAGLSWEEVEIMTLHGREGEYVDRVRRVLAAGKTVAILTDKRHSPAAIARGLLEGELEGRSTVAESLSQPDEKITAGSLAEIAAVGEWAPAVMLVESDRGGWSIPVASPGIPDDQFERGEVPLTKEEVRTVAIAKLRLGP